MARRHLLGLAAALVVGAPLGAPPLHAAPVANQAGAQMVQRGDAPSGAATTPAAAPRPPAAPRLDPAVREAAARLAAPFRLTNADGSRSCAFALKSEPGGPGLAVEFDRQACAIIAFSAQVAAWLPDPSGSLRLLNAQGRTVAEFTEGTNGSYEALREGDGVYFLANPAVAAEDAELKVEEVVGEWDLARQAGAPVCRWTLLDQPAANGAGKALAIASGCDQALLRFGPVAWDIEGGNILVRGDSGASVIRFARQEDGGWARTPERGRPLLMNRP
ncbi:protease inhibitor Inh/omp19 family protein [Xanthobacter autotrophicus]|uniref:protease inhibitor Inh/omp19 family protein n=1 Tax=Xanthobacter TaxID=279 RepID=UPI0024AB939E|nr:protease inhibitor Inh/omp19 family protein [Xanthobacter autotrophicus]MDI4664887.1 protease inhibitor Inh/omp19 family protein [Xanthobacter autotrophicus]